jgi:7,8-dihydropterin-6-yl-methyl-4-(beta-D-ribofuranosyl)aminobenzene 5'-phosphate synthase
MSVRIGLEPVDRVEITTLYENLVDMTVPGGPRVERLDSKSDQRTASSLLASEQRAEFVGGHGLSMQVRVTRGGVTRSLLYDTGGTPNGLVHNLDCLGIDPRDWGCIVLSHGHWDHTLGLIGLHRRLGTLNLPLILHPDAYLQRATVARNGKVSRMVSLSRAGLLDAGLELVEAKGPTQALDGMVLVTGQVERTNDVEIGWPAHHAERNGTLEPDPFIWDDQGLVMNLKDRGLVVVSGCAHAGIINTIHYAQAVTGVQGVHAVFGGFHLGPSFFHDRIEWVVQALVALEPAVIAPAHCTGYRAAYAVYQRRPDAFIQNTVGTRVTLSSDA